MQNWERDYLSYMHPDICEVVYDHAHDCTLQQFKDRWAPDLSDYKDKILIMTEIKHPKYGPILKDMVLLTKHEYDKLHTINPNFEFFHGEIKVSFQQLVKKTVHEPYVIFIYMRGNHNKDSIVVHSCKHALQKILA